MLNKPNTYRLEKWTKKRFHGYPLATIIYYGPTNQDATKVVVSILNEQDEMMEQHKWVSEKDLRWNEEINRQIIEFINLHKPQSVVTPGKILGCPHEEGIDYPEGENCPKCPFWANKDRWKE
ncbi:hypothetical protein EDC14_1002313 [Hydrogenispora ethanolica]|uniref:Uncharacterized protein n=1 Tax=Hydrogenispora ethanolica TaxID=1082276 RepID=A0A4R1SBB0_HYDET|nr:hypothetical protein EDC14_1002313 [Hydrogenispora ethanolica]